MINVYYLLDKIKTVFYAHLYCKIAYIHGFAAKNKIQIQHFTILDISF